MVTISTGSMYPSSSVDDGTCNIIGLPKKRTYTIKDQQYLYAHTFIFRHCTTNTNHFSKLKLNNKVNTGLGKPTCDLVHRFSSSSVLPCRYTHTRFTNLQKNSPARLAIFVIILLCTLVAGCCSGGIPNLTVDTENVK